MFTMLPCLLGHCIKQLSCFPQTTTHGVITAHFPQPCTCLLTAALIHANLPCYITWTLLKYNLLTARAG